MKYATAFDFRQALEVRLRSHSREKGVPLFWLRKQVTFDRLLARLLKMGSGRWMLKGALALDYRLPDRARTSKDMDLAHFEGVEQATAGLRQAGALDLGDFFGFEITRTSVLEEVPAGVAVRYHLDCRLGRSLFDASTVDVGFTDHFGPDPEVLTGPPLLEFAGISPVAVPALPLADQVAQKLHAWISRYGPTGQPSSRSKDLADLVIVAESFRFDAGQLRQALERTFVRCGTDLPSSLPPLSAAWRADYRRVAVRFGLEPDVEAAYQITVDFLNPVLSSAGLKASWVPDRQQWE